MLTNHNRSFQAYSAFNLQKKVFIFLFTMNVRMSVDLRTINTTDYGENKRVK